jgi:hypothetical protein
LRLWLNDEEGTPAFWWALIGLLAPAVVLLSIVVVVLVSLLTAQP